MNRYAKRVDSNQSKIVAILRQIGASVVITSGLGFGFPDLIVGYRGINYFFEIKDEDKPPSKRKLTPDQCIFRAEWQNQYHVILNADEAIAIITRGW